MKAELTAFASYLSEYLGYNLADLQKKSRKKELVRPRQQIMAYLHSVKNGTVRNENISEIFNQNHATVNHAVKCIQNDCFASAEFDYKWRLFVEHGNKYKLVILPDPEPVMELEFMDKHSL